MLLYVKNYTNLKIFSFFSFYYFMSMCEREIGASVCRSMHTPAHMETILGCQYAPSIMGSQRLNLGHQLWTAIRPAPSIKFFGIFIVTLFFICLDFGLSELFRWQSTVTRFWSQYFTSWFQEDHYSSAVPVSLVITRIQNQLNPMQPMLWEYHWSLSPRILVVWSQCSAVSIKEPFRGRA